MAKPVEEIKNRIAKALDIRGMKPIELAEKTGIPKASISQYLSGYAKPKGDRIYLLAKALSVQEAWLLGFDVDIENKIKFNLTSEAEEHLMLIALYEELNESNREKVISYMKYVLHEQKGNN